MEIYLKSKKQHKTASKCKEAVESSLYQYPYQNLSLVDMVGEIWELLPDFEEYLTISNKGRIKRLPFLVESAGKSNHWREERIVKQTIQKTKYKERETLNLQSSIKINKQSFRFLSARAVYSTFVKPLSFKEDKQVVKFHDNNPLNTTIENLYLISRSKLAKLHTRSGIISPPDYYKMPPKIQFNMKNACKKPFSQYDLDGNYIQTFDSLSDASRLCNLDNANLAYSATHPNRMCGGFLWRYGTGGAPLSKEEVDMYHNRWKDRSKPVLQYTQDGTCVATYRSIEEAARQVGCSSRLINFALNGKQRTAKGFIWKFV